MSARARPPLVDDGGPASLAATLGEVVAPSFARLRATLLVVIPMLLVLAIWETFRLPQPAIATFLPLMMARGDARSSIGGSMIAAVGVSIGALLAIVALAASLSQPAVRLPLMALMTFATMLAVRATTLGPAAFMVGFFATYGTTEADNLAALAFSPADVANTEGFGRPQIAYFPPEEALVHGLLWLGVAAAVPALLLAGSERLAGADPMALLQARLRARSDAAAAFCAGAPGAAARLRALAREGIAPLLDLVTAAERTRGRVALHDVHLRLVRGLNRLLLLLVAWDMARPAEGAADAAFLRPVGAFAGALFEADTAALPPAPPDGSEDALAGALPSLAAETRVVLAGLRAAEAERADRAWPRPAGRAGGGKPFWQPDPFGIGNRRFALKVTLTVMTGYLIESALAWQAISTCVVTCMFVALGTVGETVHKMTLRIAGALIGGTLGIAAILLLMPLMTGFGQLLALFAPVAFVSTWIAFGSPRIAYCGWQILLAFSLTTLQGYGPTLDMQAARDRVVGILLGNLVTTLVFVFVWPVRVGDAVRRDMAAAFEALGRLMAVEGEADTPEARRATEGRLRDGFAAAVARVGAVIPNDHLEPGRDTDGGGGHLGRAALTRLGRLIVPASVIATDGVEPSAREAIPAPLRAEVRAYHGAMGEWFAGAAAWVRTGTDRDRLRATLPLPPAAHDLEGAVAPSLARRVRGRLALYALLREQAADFLDEALPAQPAPATSGEGRRALAAG